MIVVMMLVIRMIAVMMIAVMMIVMRMMIRMSSSCLCRKFSTASIVASESYSSLNYAYSVH
jgi:hypothetical protein